MLNGVLQILSTGVVPGNRNLDNCADELQVGRLQLHSCNPMENPYCPLTAATLWRIPAARSQLQP